MHRLLSTLFTLHRFWLRLCGARTLGTRIIVFQNDSVLLIRQTYSGGWHLPGGGVHRGEMFIEGAHRELREECGIEAETLDLHGIYVRQSGRHTDHVAVFTARGVKGVAQIQDSREVAEVRYHPLCDLPNELLPGHRRRILEAARSNSISNSIHHDRW